MKKKILGVLTAALILLAVSGSVVFAAAEPEEKLWNVQALEVVEADKPEAMKAGLDSGIPSEAVSDRQEFITKFRELLVARVTQFRITMHYEATAGDWRKISQNNYNMAAEVFQNDAYDHTGVPFEGDYIRYQMTTSNMESQTAYKIVNRTTYIVDQTFTFHMGYMTTAAREKQVTETVRSVLDGLDLNGKSDYEIVAAIHDYICTHTVYTSPAAGDAHPRIRYSAYGALVEGKAVCQGYANLFYRMCLEMGIDVRIIPGKGVTGIFGRTEAHAWNIVKLGDLYYDIDVTWDSNLTKPGAVSREYFLKGHTGFSRDHIPDSEFRTEAFLANYPISYEDATSSTPALSGESLAGHTLSLEGDIGINFYMVLDTEIAEDPGAYMRFSIPDGRGTILKTVGVEDARYDGNYYIFKCNVAASEMNLQIEAQMFDSNGNFGDKYSYSVQEYGQTMLDNADEQHPAYLHAKPLVEAMLEYGRYAENYFSDEPALADLDVQIPEDYSHSWSNLPEGVTADGATLSLQSQTTLSLYFTSKQELTFGCDGGAPEVSRSGNVYIIRIHNIASPKLDRPITVTVNGNEDYYITYCPLTYCYNAQKSNNVKLVATVKALYLYWQAAYEYFGMA